VTQVELKENPQLAAVGKIALYSGEADDKGVAFYLEGLGIANPVGIMLISGDSATPMKLFVKNDLSADWDKRVKDEDGVSKIRFSTEGPAMALVTSSTTERKPYKILFWVGPELPLHKLIATPFVSQETYDQKHPGGGGGGNTGVIVAVIVVIAVIGLGLFAVTRRKKKAAP
jgi:hypothetical protein